MPITSLFGPASDTPTDEGGPKIHSLFGPQEAKTAAPPQAPAAAPKAPAGAQFGPQAAARGAFAPQTTWGGLAKEFWPEVKPAAKAIAEHEPTGLISAPYEAYTKGVTPAETTIIRGMLRVGEAAAGAYGYQWPTAEQHERMVQSVVNDPVMRSVAVGGATAAINYATWELAGAASGALGTIPYLRTITNAYRFVDAEAQQAVMNPALSEALAAGKRAAFHKAIREGAQLSTRLTAMSEMQVFANAKLGNPTPTSEYFKTALFSAAAGFALGVLPPGMQQFTREDIRQIQDYVRQDPGALLDLKDMQGIADGVSKDNPQVNGKIATMKVAMNKASVEQRAAVRQAIVSRPEYMGRGMGQHLLQQIHAAEPPVVIEDAAAKATDGLMVTYEDEFRNVKTVNAVSKDQIRALQKQQYENSIRITRVAGPAGKVRAFGPAIRAARVPNPGNLIDFTDAEAQKTLSQPYNPIDSRFAGLPKISREDMFDYGVQDITSEFAAEPPVSKYKGEWKGVPETKPERVTDRPPEPLMPGGPLYKPPVVGKPRPIGAVIEKVGEPRPIDKVLAESHATAADKLTDGPGGLKAQNWGPVHSGDATYSHAHPWTPIQEQSPETPVIIPATGTQALETPNTDDTAGVSHKVKMSPEAQADELTKHTPTALPASEAYPPGPDFFTSPRGDEGVDLKFALQTTPEDPRLTTFSRQKVISILQDRAGLLSGLVDKKRIDPDFPEYVRVTEALNRFTGEAPIRESTQEPDGSLIKYHDQGDGTVRRAQGAIAPVSSRVTKRGEAAELSKPLSVDDVKKAVNTRAKPIHTFQIDKLRARLALIEDTIKTTKDPHKLADMLTRKQEVTEALRKRIGTPTDDHLPPPDFDPKDLRKSMLGRFDAKARAEFLKRLKSEKGAVRMPTGWSDASGTPLGKMAKDLGHGKVFESMDGRVKVFANVYGHKVTLDFPTRQAAAAGLADLVNKEAKATQFEAEMERAISTNRLPTMARPTDADGHVRSLLLLNHAFGLDADLEGMARAEGDEFDARISEQTPVGRLIHWIKDGAGQMRDLGRWGKVGLAHAQGFLDLKDRMEGHLQKAVRAFTTDARVKGRTLSRAAMESGQDAPAMDAWNQHLKPVFDEMYQLGEALGLKMGPKIEGPYVPHVADMTHAIKLLGRKASRRLARLFVEEGLGDSEEEAFQTFIDSGGWTDIESERRLHALHEKMTMRAQRYGEPVPTIAETQRFLTQLQLKAARMVPNLTEARVGAEGMIDDPVKAAIIAGRRNHAGLAERVIFGKNLERRASIVAGIRDEVGKAPAHFADNYFNAVLGRTGGMDPGIASLMHADRTYITGAFLRHIPQNFFTMARFPMKNVMQGALHMILENAFTAEGRASMREFNISMRHSYEQYYTGDAELERQTFSGTVARVAGKLAKPGEFMLSKTINFGRRFASEVGMSFTKDQLRLAQGGDELALKRLNELFGTKMTLDSVKQITGHAAVDFVGRGGAKAADWAMFRFNPNTLPAAVYDQPMVRLFFQFKSFMYPYTRLIQNELFADPKDLSFGRSARRARMVLTLAAAMPAYSYAYSTLINSVGGDTKNTDTLVKKFNNLYYGDRRFRTEVASMGSSIAVQHTMGLYSGLIGGVMAGNMRTGAEGYSDESLPAADWLLTYGAAIQSISAGMYNSAFGNRVLGRYQEQKAVEDLGSQFGFPGRALARGLVGRAKKPRTSE